MPIGAFIIFIRPRNLPKLFFFVFRTQVLDLTLGVDFTFAWDNNNKNNDNNKNNNNPHLNFVKGTVLGDKEQGVGIRDN